MFFIFGIIIGSFINLCVYRIPRGKSIIFTASYCDNCGEKLKIYELVPVLGFIFSKGRCRRCKAKIPFYYPLIEILNGILYLCIFLEYGYSIEAIKLSIFVSIMLIITLIDLKTKYIYCNTTIAALLIGMVFIIINFYSLRQYPVANMLGSLIGIYIFLIIAKITRGMGAGDIEAAGICGWFLGLRYEILTIFLSFVIGGAVGYILMKLRLVNKNSRIVFTPFLMIGSIISILFGNTIVNWYLTFLNI